MKVVQLGELEKEVMDIVWEKKHCSTRDVLTKLDKKLAYTTVATILHRLFDKGLVIRKEDKSGYTYSPKLTKEKYSHNIAKSFLAKFTASFGDTAIASFADCIDRLPAKKRSYFLKLLNEHDKTK
jgi:predicted transcriptional regulator